MPIASTADALTRLETLIAGLLFISEADSPLRVERLAEASARAAVLASGKPTEAPVSEISVDAFLARAVEDLPYHSPTDRVVVARYRALRDFLSDELAQTRVFRVGEIDVDIYAIGQTADGDWVGVATQVIET